MNKKLTKKEVTELKSAGDKLTEKEITKFWKQYSKNRDNETRNILIEHYLYTVKYAANKIASKLPQSVDIDDLISEGYKGLIDAVEKFDLKQGNKFETYCSTRIRGAILDSLRSIDWVPRMVRSKKHKMDRAFIELETKLGRTPTDMELAKHLNVNLPELHTYLKEVNTANMLSYTCSLNEEKQDDKSFAELVEDKNSKLPSERLKRDDMKNYITKDLSKKERLVLLLYYYEGLTMKEIGNTLELSESRVSQIHAKLIIKLRAHVKRPIDLI